MDMKRQIIKVIPPPPPAPHPSCLFLFYMGLERSGTMQAEQYNKTKTAKRTGENNNSNRKDYRTNVERWRSIPYYLLILNTEYY